MTSSISEAGTVPQEVFMPKELLAETRIEIDEGEEVTEADKIVARHRAHGGAANHCIGALLERWKGGLQVGKEAFVENVHVKDGDNLVGFRFYLVVGEPQRMGPTRTEAIEPE
jgi:hypothetical protein